MVTSTTFDLTIPLPTKVVDSFIVLYARFKTTGHDGTLPVLPAGYKTLYASAGGTGFYIIATKRIVASNEPNPIVRLPSSTTASAGSMWGHVDVFGNVDYRDSGWLDIPGTAGSYATITRSTLSTPADYSIIARVSFDATGIVNWVGGWANGDVGFGLNASDKLVMYVNNTSGNPIGNAPSTVTLPVSPNQKIWIQGIVTAATGACTYLYSLDDVENNNSVHWTTLGAPVIGTNAGTTPRVTNSGTLFIGARDAATTPTKKIIYSFYDATTALGILTTAVFTDPNPAGFALVGSAVVYRPSTGNSSPIESYDVRETPLPLGTVIISPTSIYGDDRLIFNVWTSETTAAHQPFPIDPADPPGWTAYPDRFASFTNLNVKDVTRSKAASVDDPGATAAPTTLAYTFGYFLIVLRPRPDVDLPPASPQPLALVLGCAESYGLWILDADYETRLDRLEWTGIQYERALDMISSASATLPSNLGGVKCLERAGGLRPWRFGLLVERNDQEVWRGPVTNVRRVGSNIEVAAADVLARFQKLPAIFDAIVDYEHTDAGTIFRDIITTHSFTSVNRWTLPCPLVESGVVVNRVLKPREFKAAWDLMAELLSSALDAYVMNGILYVWEPGSGWCHQADIRRVLPGPYNSEYDFIYGTFTEESFSTRPDWTLDGAGQTNYVIVPGTETGEMGFREYQLAESIESQDEYGLLFSAEPDTTEIPEDAPPAFVTQILQARANTTAALRSFPPLTVEGGVLSETAPVSMDHLRPGSLWKMDVYDEGLGQLLTFCRLRRVTVSVKAGPNGVEETVSPVLEPPGWQGGVRRFASGLFVEG